MVKISSNYEMVPKGISPNLIKLAWNDPIKYATQQDIKAFIPKSILVFLPIAC